MPLATLLLPEFHSEMKILRDALAALPGEQSAYQPQPKSMSLGRLAAHEATMPDFISAILAGSIDLATAKFAPLAFESSAQIVEAFDGMVAKTAGELEATTDERFAEPWSLGAGERIFFSGNLYEGYRMFGMNHMIHHRGQLGVYLRLLDVPVPRVYGPSADFPM